MHPFPHVYLSHLVWGSLLMLFLLLYTFIGCRCPTAGVGGCRVPCKERLGLPRASHSRFQQPLYFSIPKSILNDNKIKLPQVQSLSPITVIGTWAPCLYVSPWAFFLPHAAGRAFGPQPRLPHHNVLLNISPHRVWLSLHQRWWQQTWERRLKVALMHSTR